MGQRLGLDVIPAPTRVSGTSVQNTGTQRVTIGGQQYASTSTLTINTATTGAGGLDAGALSTNQLWYIHYVVSGGALALLASLSKTAPTGFTLFAWSGYAFITDGSSAVLGVGTLQVLVVVREILSGSGNYTANTGCTVMEVEGVGGGGGGAGTGAGATNGGNGGSTTFGSSLITIPGGTGGSANGNAGTAGGAPTVNAPAFKVAGFNGAEGNPCGGNIAATSGGDGGSSVYGGGGLGGFPGATQNGDAGQAPGAGGGGGGRSTGSGGGGGASGSFAKALVYAPSGAYAYATGAAGTAGAGAQTGGAGVLGRIQVTERFA